MDKKLKFSLYLFLFGLLTLYVVIFREPFKKTYSTAEVLGQQTKLELFIEPDDGETPILNYLNLTNNEVLTEVYLFSNPIVINALSEVASRGASVKVLMEEHPFGGMGLNQKTKPLLEKAGILVSWTNPTYPLTHEKTMIFDAAVVCILNLNLTKAAFTSNREYNICSRNPEEVTEAKNIFLADWNKKDITPKAKNLVVSPINSRGKLTALISSAEKSLDIEIEVLTDPQIIDLITSKAKTLPVRIIIPPKNKVDNPLIPGTQTKKLRSPYPHAKLIIVDGIRAYTGSINLTAQSLDRNRELGILISQPNILERLNQTFTKDWDRANL